MKRSTGSKAPLGQATTGANRSRGTEVPEPDRPVQHKFFGDSLARVSVRLVLVAAVAAFGILFMWTLIANGRYPLAVLVFLVTAGVCVSFTVERLYPFRWFSPGLALMAIMLLYPTAYTMYVAFTNYGDGHLLTRVQVIDQLERQTYRPEDGRQFTWTAFRSERGEFVLWLQSDAGSFLAEPGEPFIPADRLPNWVGPLDTDGIPTEIRGYTRLNRTEVLRFLTQISALEFGELPETVRVQSLDLVEERRQRFVFDPANDTMTDQRDGTVYRPVTGTFTAEDGTTLRPGFWVTIGPRNFQRLFTSPALSGPFIRVFVWTFVFAFFSVLLTFTVGLFFALVFDHPKLPAKRLIRSLLLVPYALPAFISVNIWRGMFSRHFGLISTTLEAIFGWSPLWLANPVWARVGILITQTWLGFPYMMLICTGALQSLPNDIFEAATIDGAGALRKFWNLTLPLLMVAVGPLLIASFAFNFNNFTVIDIYAEGGPPMAGTTTPAGHTDILITYIFRLAFAGGRGADFGYASAITMVIFLILAIITALQFRYTRVWEEISENV
ncbi:MAG: maltose ABC transporter permease MalF [Spirochaetaceae bacterium]|nr:MAG: maltose ABC transporter permease MalF [Spirochaetaceae bacterium]